MEDENHCTACKKLFNTPVSPNKSPEELYGSNEQEIKMLENSLQSEYINFIFTDKLTIWPSIMFQVNILELDRHFEPSK
ncbi:Hypothetical protein CINCED_3A019015 [Cinara cedri]|uniref:Uncharacterized protein n=1 Tax=Cinara cedri TaxID=506608 RepID=A0A5E4N6Z5_9HEMI|nr:Hypothetical protein CINCED_3A019015 [Cinara cedri]